MARRATTLVTMEPVVRERGVAMYGYMPSEREYDEAGRVQAGVVTLLLETAMAAVVESVVGSVGGFELAELKTTFLRPVRVDSGPLRVEGQVVHAGPRAALAEAKVVDAEGRVFALATCTAVRVSLAA